MCSDAVEKAGMCKPGCFCKAKSVIRVRYDWSSEEVQENLGDILAKILATQKRHAVAMGLHARLGADSILQTINEHILQMIFANALVDRDNMPDRIEPPTFSFKGDASEHYYEDEDAFEDDQ